MQFYNFCYWPQVVYCWFPVIANPTFGNRDLSNSIRVLRSMKFGSRTKSNTALCVVYFQTNRSQSNKSNAIEPNRTQSNPIKLNPLWPRYYTFRRVSSSWHHFLKNYITVGEGKRFTSPGNTETILKINMCWFFRGTIVSNALWQASSLWLPYLWLSISEYTVWLGIHRESAMQPYQ